MQTGGVNRTYFLNVNNVCDKVVFYWAGSLVWLGYLPDTEVVESSNLSRPISFYFHVYDVIYGKIYSKRDQVSKGK